MIPHRKILAAAAISLAGFIAMPAAAQDELSADTVLVNINGKDITLGHVIALRSNLPPHYAQLEDQVLFDGILEQLVQHELLSQSLGDELTPRTALTIENETRAIRAGAAITGVTDAEISETELQDAYEEAYVQGDPDVEYSAAHILVESQEEAETLIQSLSEGAEFAELAREHSTGPSGPNGGELGWFGKGVMVEPFFEAVLALDKGEVSDPVKTQFGWHVIKLLDTRTLERPTLDEVRESLTEELREARFEAHMDALEGKADIDRTALDNIPADVVNKTELLEP